MNCNIFKENIYHLFEEDIPQYVKDEMMQHIRHCTDCRQEYEDMKELLSEMKPAININASEGLKSKIINQIEKETNMNILEKEKKQKYPLPKWSKYAIAAAIIIGAIIVVPFIKWKSKPCGEVCAANNLFDNSITTMLGIKSLYINLNIRTIENDNFELIETEENFVKNEIWKEFSTPAKWKIAKAGREVLMDGQNQYLYIKDRMGIKAGIDAGFVDWLKIFLEPTLLMENEKRFADKNKAKYTIEEKDNKITLTIVAKALGNFENDYMLNKSIMESNNTRIYTFDKNSNLLESFQMYINKKDSKILVVESKEIKYNIDIPAEVFTIKLPEGISWTESKEIMPKKSDDLKNITSVDAAKLFFEGMAENDWDKVKKVFPLSFDQDFKDNWGGLKIISIGKAFKSGSYPGQYVPYEIKFKNGETKKYNLAVRNDNKDMIWQVDGGF